MRVSNWRVRCCALAAGGCLLLMTGCGANVVGPIARWRYQLSIQRPLQIEQGTPGVAAPYLGDPAPCDRNRCPIRHSRKLTTLPKEPTGLPPHPNFHPVPVCPVFGPPIYGGSPPASGLPMEEIHVQPSPLTPPTEGLKQMPAPPMANPPEAPPDSQASKGWYRTPPISEETSPGQVTPASYGATVQPQGATVQPQGNANVRFLDR
jgi:hypothetical protein